MSNDTDFELDEMQEIVDDFLVEADELIASLDQNLVRLEASPGDLDLLNEIFRAAHTIKGTSCFLGFEQVTNLTHSMEDVLNKLRRSEIAVTPDIMDLLLESVDVLKVLLDNVRKGNQEEVALDDIIGRLASVCGEQPDPVESLSSLMEEVSAAVGEDETSVVAPDPVKADSVRSVGDRKMSEQTIRVDVNRLDALMNLVGELVLSRNSLLQTINSFEDNDSIAAIKERLGREGASVNYISTELQLAVMKMRMQPVGKVFGKFPRLVRDLTRENGKNIELKISGETTELDKSVIDEIGDPLVHLVRNSCDHGIESPADRVAKGKPAEGVVRLSASQEGSHIVIKIEDDGKGLNVEAIKEKAVERGLVSRADVERLPDRDIFGFIFEPGFSTAKVVTDVSGRGVGMDVVRTNIEKLNGLVEIASTKDVGTTISIKLPLTLAIIRGLLIQSDDEVFILPLSSVSETVRTAGANISYVNQRPVLRLRDEVVPVVNLGEILRSSTRGFVLTEKPYIVIVGLADRKLGIITDRFLGQEEVVIKSLGGYLGATEGVAGAAILGDGRIRLIVDLMGLFGIAKKLS